MKVQELISQVFSLSIINNVHFHGQFECTKIYNTYISPFTVSNLQMNPFPALFGEIVGQPLPMVGNSSINEAKKMKHLYFNLHVMSSAQQTH